MPNWTVRLACFCCLLPLALPVPAAAAAPVRVVTTELPPYAMAGDPAAPGALLEIVQELLRRTQIEGKVEFVPWRRAILLTTTGKRAAIFPLSRTAERETQYRWLVRLYHERFVFLSTTAPPAGAPAPAQEKRRRIGVLRGSVATSALRELGYSNIIEAASVEEELRFLQHGIVDAVFGESAIFHHTLGERIGASYTVSPTQHTENTWLGGSLDFSEADAALLARARKEMVEDGSYARILKKYGLPPMP